MVFNRVLQLLTYGKKRHKQKKMTLTRSHDLTSANFSQLFNICKLSLVCLSLSLSKIGYVPTVSFELYKIVVIVLRLKLPSFARAAESYSIVQKSNNFLGHVSSLNFYFSPKYCKITYCMMKLSGL